ncbi:hypothetical protein [Variovorax sp. UC122_21]|uniref:hypothetical protein n=1 Tax=Variovorax sp. UC122_21 TaxID=3374554 RepID=UPI0037564488
MQLGAARARRLQGAEQARAMEVVDGLVGHAAQPLGLRGALPQHGLEFARARRSSSLAAVSDESGRRACVCMVGCGGW